MDIKDIIRKLRIDNDMTQAEFGKVAGVSDKAVSTWENGTAVPRMGAIQRMSEYFNVPKAYIMGDVAANPQGRPLPSNIITPAAYAVPVLGTIYTGDGVVAEESFKSVFYVDKSIKADYCLIVKGNSMTGVGIHDGDVAFLIKDFDFVDGKIYAVVFGPAGDASLKRVSKAGDKLILSPCNPEYSPVIEAPSDVLLIGELVGHYHKDK
ncbi:MAG: LexA family protein [Anaerovoracaceae bacterium]